MAAWSAIDGLVHAFFGRNGGHSSGPCHSLNLSEKVGDSPTDVRRNWEGVKASLGGLDIVRMKQVHGTDVVSVERAGSEPGECDGLFTRTPGIAMSVMTADCVPVLMVAASQRAAMALHAGWRGTVTGIVASGLEAAKRSGIDPADWQVAMGPSIGGCCYEVSSEIGEGLQNRWGSMPDAWQPAGQRGQLDLRRANLHILLSQGVSEDAIHAIGPCTACANEQYFSHRKSLGNTGRQASLIGFRW